MEQFDDNDDNKNLYRDSSLCAMYRYTDFSNDWSFQPFRGLSSQRTVHVVLS